MITRQQFVQEACGRSEQDVLGRRGQLDFEKVTAELRSIARKLDPGTTYKKADWSDRECLCGRLAVLIVKNPEQAAEALTDSQKQLAVAIMQMQIEEADQQLQQQRQQDDDGEPSWYEDKNADDENYYSNRRKLAAMAKAALLAAPTLASAAATSSDSIVFPVLAAAATYLVTTGLQWGGSSLRKVSSAISEHAALQKKSHYSGMRRALSNYSTSTFGGENTYDLRNRMLRGMTMDAQTINNYIQSSGSVNGAANLDQFLLNAVRQRVQKKSAAQEDINSIIGKVLSEFTFGGSVLRPFVKENLHCAFIPCAGVAHVGYNNASDQEEFIALKNLFAEHYFKPSKKISSLNKIPENIVLFWSVALANALNPDTKNHVPDSVLYTMYYFIFRHVYKYNLIASMRCPEQMHRSSKLRAAASLSHGSLPADAAMECVFSDYDKRHSAAQTWTEWFKSNVGLAGFGK